MKNRLISAAGIAGMLALVVIGATGFTPEMAAVDHHASLYEWIGTLALGGILINRPNMLILNTGFQTAFQVAFDGVEPTYSRVAMDVPSSTSQEDYGWLGMIPRFREWIGDRVLQNLNTYDFIIKNKTFELTVTAEREKIEDDHYGIYSPIISEMGRASRIHPDELTWPLLNGGFASLCYDGKNFFDTTHPVLDANGTPQNVSNSGGGAGTPWFLLDTTRMVKPLVFQRRRPYNFTSLQSFDDPNVFFRREFIWGVDARVNAGYGLWQLAYGSKVTLDAAGYQTARAAMVGMTGDYGRPLGLQPNLLVVPSTLEAAARTILKAPTNANGSSNVWFNSADLLVVPWLG